MKSDAGDDQSGRLTIVGANPHCDSAASTFPSRQTEPLQLTCCR